MLADSEKVGQAVDQGKEKNEEDDPTGKTQGRRHENSNQDGEKHDLKSLDERNIFHVEEIEGENIKDGEPKIQNF